MYELYLDGCLFPMAPSSFTVQRGGRNRVVDLIDDGQINEIHLPALASIKMDLFLPDVALPYAMYEDYFHDSRYYLNKIEAMANVGKNSATKTGISMQLIRSRDGQMDLSSNDLDLQVCLESYGVTEDAKGGMGVMVSLTWREYKKESTTVMVMQANGTMVAQAVRGIGAVEADYYTVAKGDTLWGIAKKKLNNAGYASKIYELNATVIEDAAKKNGRESSSKGHWIYPGTALKMPQI